MKRRDIHETYDFFEYVRVTDSVPPAEAKRIDVAVLDMNHSWPNIGHDSVIHAILDTAEEERTKLVGAGLKVRAISYDVRRRHLIPESPNGRFQLYLGTGGPGHLDPRQNDGTQSFAQGIKEDPAWEAPLFRLFEAIEAKESAALIALCHSFGLLCRWSGAARPEMREEKSSGMPTNTLTEAAAAHPWFSQFLDRLPGRQYRVVDNRLFDLVLDQSDRCCPLSFESERSHVMTMMELAREKESGMPRILGANHHPEIIDRQHVLAVLQEKREHGEVSEQWYRERANTMTDLFHGENERQSRLTSEFTLLGPLRHHLRRVIGDRL